MTKEFLESVIVQFINELNDTKLREIKGKKADKVFDRALLGRHYALISKEMSDNPDVIDRKGAKAEALGRIVDVFLRPDENKKEAT